MTDGLEKAIVGVLAGVVCWIAFLLMLLFLGIVLGICFWAFQLGWEVVQ